MDAEFEITKRQWHYLTLLASDAGVSAAVAFFLAIVTRLSG
jgi:hypothetical protein